MRILAIDTSGRLASCSLYEDGKEVASCTRDSQMDHSRTILPLCEEMVREQGLTFKDIDAYAAAVGPGSFTGIRIGVAAVKGFALSGNKPAAGISTLEATAALVPQEGLICSIIRARENEYFYGFFRNVRGELYRICDDECMSGSELKSILYGADWLLCEAFCLLAHADIFKPYEKHHSTVADAAKLAAELGIPQLVLWHTEDKNYANRKALYTAEAREHYHGDLYVPNDLEVIAL